MPSMRVLAVSALLAVANAQLNLISAKGNSGESFALQLRSNDTKDAQIMNDAEIKANIVNQCGRTLLAGNIDIGQNTEDAIAAKAITTVTKGSKVEATFKQVGNAKISCDLDLSSNGNGATGQTKLQGVQSKDGQNVKMTLTLPTDMKLFGGSTGDIGTIRCRDANNFGSCFPIQQTDVTPNQNRPDNIQTTDTVENLLKKVAGNKKAFPDVAAASAKAKTEDEQGTAVVDALLKVNPDVAKTNPVVGGGNANTGNNNNNANKGNKAGGNANKAGNGKNNAANGAARGNRKNNAAGARKNNAANRNRRVVKRDDSYYDKRAVAMLAMKWARSVLEEEN